MSITENIENLNNLSTNSNPISRYPRNIQRIALTNVTNTAFLQDNLTGASQVLRDIKPVNNNGNGIHGDHRAILSNKGLVDQTHILKESNTGTVRTIASSMHLNILQPSNQPYQQLRLSRNIENSNNTNNVDIMDKENQDPLYVQSKVFPPIHEERLPPQRVLDSIPTAASTGAVTDAAATDAREDDPAAQKDIDGGKKRPTSAVVEQQEPKKFKVCDENGAEEYEWEDLDAEDANDPFMVSEYVNDIFDYLHHLEILTLPRKEDLYKHRNIRQNRDILVNWLVKIHNKFGLLPETLYLAINIMDRFLCKELVQLDKLQLVGTSCLFIASKYEEVYSPSIKHFASETDGACTEEEIKEGEKFILKTLEFSLNYPNPMNFLRRISKADDYDIRSRTLAKFLLEISLVDFRFIGILPSLCAAAAMFLARKMLGKGKWDGNLIHYSGGYTKEQLAPVCHTMMDYLISPIVHDEFYKKYQSRRFMKASIISVQWAIKVKKNDYDIMTLHE